MEPYHSPLHENGQYPYVNHGFSFLGASDSGSFDTSWDGDPLPTSTIPTEYPYDIDPLRPYFEGDLFEIVAEGKTEPFHSLSAHLTDFTAGVLPSPVVSYPVIGSNHPLAEDGIDVVPSPTAQPHAPASSSSIHDASHPSPHSPPGPFYEGKEKFSNTCSSHSQDMGQMAQLPKHVKRYRRYLICPSPWQDLKVEQDCPCTGHPQTH